LEKEEWLNDPRFNSPQKRLENKKEFIEIVERILSTKTTEEWLGLFHKMDIPASPINTLDKALSLPPVLDYGMVISTEYQGHPIRVLGNPINLSSTPEDKRRQFTSPPLMDSTLRSFYPSF